MNIDVDSASKSSLRQYFMKLRTQISPTERQLAERKINDTLYDILLAKSIKSVGIYYPIKDEISLLPLAQALLNNGIKVSAPVTKLPTISFHEISSLADFSATGPYNIPEPNSVSCPQIIPDAIILPGLAYDKDGNRLGYGQGCYDRYLQSYLGLTIGINYSQLLSPTQLPTEDFDQKVMLLVTEEGSVNLLAN